MAEKMRGILATTTQVICYPGFWLLAFVVCRASVQNNLSLPKGSRARFLIAANHQSRLDPFVITGILGPRFWKRLLPYRYMTANQYLYKPSLVWLLWPLGGFPAFARARCRSGLDEARALMDMGQTVCIFPEGQRALPGMLRPKRGVSVLADEPHTYVIPINMQWQLHSRKVTITIGPAYKAGGHTAEKIMGKIYSLPNGLK